MPGGIGAIIAGALGLAGTVGTVVAIGINAAITFGVALLSRLLSPRRTPLEALDGVKHTIRAEVVNARWVLGKARTPGVLCYWGSEGRVAKMGLVLSEGACEKIEERVWIDGHAVKLVRTVAASGDLLTPITTSEYHGKIEIREYFKADGSQGTQMQTAAATIDYTYDGQDGPGVFGADPTLFTEHQRYTDPAGNVITQSFVTPFPAWTAEHKLIGLSWVYVKLTQPDYGQDLDARFWNSVPNLEFLVKGIKIPWPSQTTPAWTENAAALRYWWETVRRGRLADDIHTGDFTAAYNLCEQDVDVTNDGADPLPADYSGFNPVSKRYSINGVISAGDDVSQVEDQLDAAWAGEVVEVAGQLRFRPGVDKTVATLALTDADIVEPPVVQPWAPLQERVNAISTEIAQSRSHEWTVLGLPQYTDAAALNRDGVLRPGSIQMAFVDDPIAAGRLQAILLRRSRESLRLELVVKPGNTFQRLALIPTDRVKVTNSEFGLSDARMEVERVMVREDWSVELTLREDLDDTFADTLVLPSLHPRVIRVPDRVEPKPRTPDAPNVILVASGLDTSSFYALLAGVTLSSDVGEDSIDRTQLQISTSDSGHSTTSGWSDPLQDVLQARPPVTHTFLARDYGTYWVSARVRVGFSGSWSAWSAPVSATTVITPRDAGFAAAPTLRLIRPDPTADTVEAIIGRPTSNYLTIWGYDIQANVGESAAAALPADQDYTTQVRDIKASGSGTVVAGGRVLSVSGTSPGWTDDEHVGRILYVYRSIDLTAGTVGTPQAVTIVANTADTITAQAGFTFRLAPDATDETVQFLVAEEWLRVSDDESNRDLVSRQTLILRSGTQSVDEIPLESHFQLLLPEPTWVRVRAHNLYGLGPWSDRVQVGGDLTPPGAPTALSVEALPAGFRAEWSNPMDDDFAATEVYTGTSTDFDMATLVATVDTDWYEARGLTPGTEIHVWVRAVDQSGNFSEAHGPESVIPLPALYDTQVPDAPTVEAVGSGLDTSQFYSILIGIVLSSSKGAASVDRTEVQVSTEESGHSTTAGWANPLQEIATHRPDVTVPILVQDYGIYFASARVRNGITGDWSAWSAPDAATTVITPGDSALPSAPGLTLVRPDPRSAAVEVIIDRPDNNFLTLWGYDIQVNVGDSASAALPSTQEYTTQVKSIEAMGTGAVVPGGTVLTVDGTSPGWTSDEHVGKVLYVYKSLSTSAGSVNFPLASSIVANTANTVTIRTGDTFRLAPGASDPATLTDKTFNFLIAGGWLEVSSDVDTRDLTIRQTLILRSGNTFAEDIPLQSLLQLVIQVASYARVRANNVYGLGPWSAVQSIDAAQHLPDSPGEIQNLSTSRSGTTVTVTWDELDDADSYEWRRRTGSTGTWTAWTETTTRSLTYSGSAGTTYYWEVRGKNAGGTGPSAQVSHHIPAATAPNPVTGLTCSASGTSITVSWTAVAGVDGYRWREREGTTGNWGAWNTTTSTSFTRSNRTRGSTYYYQVRSRKSSLDSASRSCNATVAPPTPANCDATVDSTTITFSWDSVASATAYEWREKEGASGTWSGWTETTSTSVTRSNLTEGSTYYYEVRAKNSAGNSAVCSDNVPVPTTPTVPGAVTDLTCTVVTTTITLSWTAVTGATSYEWREKEGASGTWSGWTETTSTPVTRSNLTEGSTYYYEVRGKNSTGTGTADDANCEVPSDDPPDPVTNLSATLSGLSITVSWDSVTEATSYEWREKAGSGSFGSWTETTSTSFTRSNRATDTTYTYEVRSKNSDGESSAEDVEITVPAIPVAPTGLTASISGLSITVSWTAVTEATSYEWREKAGSGSFGSWTETTSTSFTRTNRSAGTTYTYEVRSKNGSGTGTASSTSATVPAIPVAPTGLTASISGTTITVSWTAVTGATSYEYRSRVVEGQERGEWSAWASTTSTSLSLQTDEEDVEIDYQVRALNGSGTGPASSTSVTVP